MGFCQSPFNIILQLWFFYHGFQFLPVNYINGLWLNGFEQRRIAWAALPCCPISIIKMHYLDYVLVAMLALSTANIPILNIINYCKLCDTQDCFVCNNTFSYAELQFLACMYDFKTLFYIDIQCFVAHNALWLRSTHCDTALHSIGTQHCKSQ